MSALSLELFRAFCVAVHTCTQTVILSVSVSRWQVLTTVQPYLDNVGMADFHHTAAD